MAGGGYNTMGGGTGMSAAGLPSSPSGVRGRRQLSKRQRQARDARKAIAQALGLETHDVRKVGEKGIEEFRRAKAFSGMGPPPRQATSLATGGGAPTGTGAPIGSGGLADNIAAIGARPPEDDRRRGPNFSPRELDILFRTFARVRGGDPFADRRG